MSQEQRRNTAYRLGVIAGLVIISLALLYARFRLKHESEARLRTQAEAYVSGHSEAESTQSICPSCIDYTLYPVRLDPLKLQTTRPQRA